MSRLLMPCLFCPYYSCPFVLSLLLMPCLSYPYCSGDFNDLLTDLFYPYCSLPMHMLALCIYVQPSLTIGLWLHVTTVIHKCWPFIFVYYISIQKRFLLSINIHLALHLLISCFYQITLRYMNIFVLYVCMCMPYMHMHSPTLP